MKDNSKQYKFKEGETHLFTINGFTEIPGTDESFYILKNQLGGKHLLKSVHYKHYNLKVDQEINCKIDKINCSGKIYLEPENPIYKVGETYVFDFIKFIDHINSVGEKEKAAVLKDQFGIEVVCSLPKDCELSDNIKSLQCQILRIKKGILYLALPDKAFENDLVIGEKYWFNVTEIKQLEENTDYYILKDHSDNSYSLKYDMYKHYDFKIGQKVECTVTKYNIDGHLKIEPTHPHYKVGEIYSFEYLETKHELDPLGNEEHVVIVLDVYGVETKVRSRDITADRKFEKTIQCKVDGIRKGKAILSLA
jgi:hypothetical protein